MFFCNEEILFSVFVHVFFNFIFFCFSLHHSDTLIILLAPIYTLRKFIHCFIELGSLISMLSQLKLNACA